MSKDALDTDGLYESDRESGPDEVERKGRERPKQTGRGDRPLPLNYLLKRQTRRTLVDWVLTGADPDELYTKSAIEEETGVSRQAIIDNIGVLVDFGLLVAEGENAPRYTINQESPLLPMLIDVNEAMMAEYK